MEYDASLDRALDRTPAGGADGERFAVPEPCLRQEGHVTVYENFGETLDVLDRDADHLLGALQSALGTSGTIDEGRRARLTGSFTPERVSAVLAEYVETYVRCPECGLPDTTLERTDGTLLLACAARSPVEG